MHISAKTVKEEELIRLLLAGYMVKECAAPLNLSVVTVRSYAKKPEFLAKLRAQNQLVFERVDEELKVRADSIVLRMQEYSDQVLDEMFELAMNAKNEQIKLKACQDLLDRDNRVSRTRKIEGTQDHSFLTPMTLIHAAQVAKEVDERPYVVPSPGEVLELPGASTPPTSEVEEKSA